MAPPIPTPQRLTLVLGTGAAAVVFVVLGTLHALTIPPYLPADEPPHVGYVLVLRAGQLPTIDTPIPDGWSEQLDAVVARNAAGIGPHRRDVLAANHPPLLYVIAQVPFAVGERLGDPEDALRLARVTSVVLAAGAVPATAFLSLALLPGRVRAAITAAWFTALLPLQVHVSAFFYTDGLAVTTFIAALAASAWMVRFGWSMPRLAAVAAFGALAPAVRASGLAATGAAGLAALIAGARTDRPGAVRARRAVGGAALVGGAFAVVAGWFFVRNIGLYGDPTGGAAMMEKVGRAVPEPWLAPLRNAFTWQLWTQDYWEGFASGVKPLRDLGWRPVIWAIIVAILVGGVLAVARRGRTVRFKPEGVWPWVPPLAAAVALVASVVQFIGAGGGLHPRYALPLLGLVATLVAACLEGYPGRRQGLPTLALVGVMVALHVVLLPHFLAAVEPWSLQSETPWQALQVALAGAGVAPGVAIVTAGVALAACIGVLGWCFGGSSPSEEQRVGSLGSSGRP